MKLIIAEKPSQARTYAQALGMKNIAKGSDYFQEGDWIVVSCYGHLLAQYMPDQYDTRYKGWRLDDLPFIPTTWKSMPGDDRKKKRVQFIKDIFKNNKIDTIYHGADPDREGELIVREVLDYIGIKGIPMLRVWSNSQQVDTIKKAIEEAQPIKEYDSLGDAADMRQKADYLIGINLTRAYTSYSHTVSNVGRVVSATINLIVEKQKEIDAFIPTNYAIITASLTKDGTSFDAKYRLDQDPESTEDITVKAKEIAKFIKNKKAKVLSIEKKQDITKRQLYNLTELQADCYTRFGYDPTQVLDFCQTLYERGYITYPRTSSHTINEDQVAEISPLLIKAYNDIFSKPSQVDTSTFDISRIVVKKGEGVEASHTGLCPTPSGIEKYHTDIKKNKDLRAVFLLLVSRLMCSVMDPLVTEKTKVNLDIESYQFSANGSVTLQPGFMPFEKIILKAISTKTTKAKAADVELPVLKEGDELLVSGAKTQTKKTTPPKQYTNSSLLNTMENISNVLTEKELKKIMISQNAGLGTSATRHTIIDTINKSGFIEGKSGYFYPTDKAKALMEILPDDVKSPVMTANLEAKLDNIAKGKGSPDDFYKEVVAQVKKQVDDVKHFTPIPDTKRYVNNKVFMKEACPKCGADVVETDKSFVCRNNCGFIMWRNIAKKKVTKEEFKAILDTGKSSKKLEGFKSKAGKEFSCWLYLDDDAKIVFDFDDNGKNAQNNYITKNLAAKKNITKAKK